MPEAAGLLFFRRGPYTLTADAMTSCQIMVTEIYFGHPEIARLHFRGTRQP